MSEASLLLVSGPAGAGKSEFAELWASTRPYPCARVSPDDLWTLIKSGRADPVEGWSEETARQHEMVLDGAAALVQNFIDRGFSVVVDDVVFPSWPDSGLEAWRRRLPDVKPAMVVLTPSWDVIVARNAERSGRDNLPEQMLRKIYDDMAGWSEQSEYAVIDNSEMTVEQCAKQAEELLG